MMLPQGNIASTVDSNDGIVIRSSSNENKSQTNNQSTLSTSINQSQNQNQNQNQNPISIMQPDQITDDQLLNLLKEDVPSGGPDGPDEVDTLLMNTTGAETGTSMGTSNNTNTPQTPIMSHQQSHSHQGSLSSPVLYNSIDGNGRDGNGPNPDDLLNSVPSSSSHQLVVNPGSLLSNTNNNNDDDVGDLNLSLTLSPATGNQQLAQYRRNSNNNNNNNNVLSLSKYNGGYGGTGHNNSLNGAGSAGELSVSELFYNGSMSPLSNKLEPIPSTTSTTTSSLTANGKPFKKPKQKKITNGQSGPAKRPAFVMKLWNMVNDSSNEKFISWLPKGDAFQVSDREGFMKNVLPKYFRHNNFASFVRQLNM
ncbi:unnamed protein product [Ambrosiozyma monospora]|uniref:Heat shock transcription factor n=1 Tax=Ambrosiozyma monospora TaxID=43982 RepID=A0A9W6YX25_AMBMO|nr:unnamed protein product [Ambrosiozyma monospora]